MHRILLTVITGLTCCLVACQSSTEENSTAVTRKTPENSTDVFEQEVHPVKRDTVSSNQLERLKVKGLEVQLSRDLSKEDASKRIEGYVQNIEKAKSKLVMENRSVSADERERYSVPFETLFALYNINELKYFKVIYKENNQRKTVGYYVTPRQIVAVVANSEAVKDITVDQSSVYFYNHGYWVNDNNKGSQKEASMLYKFGIAARKILGK
tara:strand:+ start:1965 stop:2597 length:633 start_codon:yes stop_codon:yes gene_type:complete